MSYFIGMEAEYCNEHVYLSVGVLLSARISLEPHSQTSPYWLPLAVVRSTSGVAILCTSISGFPLTEDDVHIMNSMAACRYRSSIAAALYTS